MPERTRTVWFEVEDFLRYFDHYASPTGIYRVSFEIFSAAHQLCGDGKRVKFCRLSMFTGRFERLSFDQIREAYTSRRGAAAPWNILPLPRNPGRKWRAILGAVARFPRYAYRVLGQFAGEIAKARRRGDEGDLNPGDVLVSLSGTWITHNFCGHIARLKQDHKIRFVQLIHDIIPILHPEWTPWFGPTFYRWVKKVVGVSDLLLTVSRHSREDLLTLAAKEGFLLPPVKLIRFGTGFPSGTGSVSGSPLTRQSASLDSLPERFVLCVSTFETRKNHELLLTVWRKLIADHGAEKTPHLVLVGRVGYFVLDTRHTRAKLLNPQFNQRIVVAGHLTDRELEEVYRRCLFTVFPSLYEGWGLPVEESLVHGKFCVASRSSSMPEVGGDLADYFDPEDAVEAQRVLERVLFEPGYLALQERRIRNDYHPASWLDCARKLIHHMEQLSITSDALLTRTLDTP